jgi:hypothetical protein
MLTILTVAALLLVFNLGETATAQMRGTKSDSGIYRGKCPPGTCAQNGGKVAKDIKNCAASNCKRPQ